MVLKLDQMKHIILGNSIPLLCFQNKPDDDELLAENDEAAAAALANAPGRGVPSGWPAIEKKQSRFFLGIFIDQRT